MPKPKSLEVFGRWALTVWPRAIGAVWKNSSTFFYCFPGYINLSKSELMMQTFNLDIHIEKREILSEGLI